MPGHVKRTPLPRAAALLSSLTVTVGLPLVALPAHAMQTSPTAITLAQAEKIAHADTYIPAGYTLSSSSYNAAQTGQTAQYDLNYTENGSVSASAGFLNVTVDATTGMILNYYRPPTTASFHFPAAVSPRQAQVLAVAWIKRLYGRHAAQVKALPAPSGASSLTTPITYSFDFERVVDGIPAPFDGFSITLSANGHLTQVSANWTTLSFPSAHPAVSPARAQAIYRGSLHFHLLYGQQYVQGVNPATILAYTQPSAPYPSNWNTPFAGNQSVMPPVIDATSGQVVNSSGVAQPLPVHRVLPVLIPDGPTSFPGKTGSDWTQAQALAYATRLLHIPARDALSSAQLNTQPPTNDKVWNFTWNASSHQQIFASVDATQGVLTSYDVLVNGPGQPIAKGKSVLTLAQDARLADAFVRRIFPDNTGGITVSPSPFQKFPGGSQPFFTIRFLYHGIAVQSAEGGLSIDGQTGSVASFNWQPVAGLAQLPDPSRAVPVGQVVDAWMKADPLTLQYLLTQPQSGLPGESGARALPPAHIVLAYAPVGYYGSGLSVDALTGAVQAPGQTPGPYTGPIADLAGVGGAAQVQLLAGDGLLPVSPNGDVHPHEVMTQAAFVAMVVNALGLDNPIMLPGAEVSGMPAALAAVPPTSPDYAALMSAWSRGWLAGTPTFAPAAPATRGFAAQILARALGFGPALAAPGSFHLAAADATSIPAAEYAGDALAVALGMLPLRDGKFDAGAGLTIDQAAQAAVAMANAYAQGAQTDQPAGGGMGA